MDNSEIRQLKLRHLRQMERGRIIQNLSDYDLIRSVHPSLAKHILMKNDIVKKFAYQYQGCIDIMEQPMCAHCEKPALWHDGGTGYCESCGRITKNPLTFREFFIQELRGKSLEDLELILINLSISEKTGGEFKDEDTNWIPAWQDNVAGKIILT